MDPKPFAAQFPDLHTRLQEMIQSAQKAGPLDLKTQLLVRLAVCAALQLENAFRAYASQALKQGIGPGEMDHAVLTNLGIIGFPKTLAALAWAHAVTGESPFR